jgi:hypothetical protein
MQMPDEFKKICRNMGQDMDLIAVSVDDLVAFALHETFSSELGTVEKYLNELLTGAYSPEALKELWWSSPADMIFHDGNELMAFLELLRAEVIRRKSG